MTTTITITVAGLSGSDKQKIPYSVGKSALCNRLVRPGHDQYFPQHISTLSQADFSGSPVINNNHWLYWGEASLGDDYHGRITHVRVIEQTEFINDETSEPIRASGQSCDYIKRATQVSLESADKLMYICRDQLGDESSYELRALPDGKTTVDAFIVVVDVSRNVPNQSDFVCSLVQAAVCTKKPVFLVATKVDAVNTSYTGGTEEISKLLRRKECKHIVPHVVQTSALLNVNTNELLKFVANTLEKRGKVKISPYCDALSNGNLHHKELREGFSNLISQMIPKEDWPKKHSEINVNALFSDRKVSEHPLVQEFVGAFGQQAALRVIQDHIQRCKDWWTIKEQRDKIPAFRKVLLELFDPESLVQASWEDVAYDLSLHPMYSSYFKPQGQSLNRFTTHSQDSRIPTELLNSYESQRMFFDLQKEISNKVIVDEQTNRFFAFLSHKEIIVPGRSYDEAKLLVNEIETYEKILPPGHAEEAYADYQKKLVQQAERDLIELFEEQIRIFATYFINRQHNSLPFSWSPVAEKFFLHYLHEDKRFLRMSCLAEKRKKLLQRHAKFIATRSYDDCPAGNFCFTKYALQIIESSKNCYFKYAPVHIVVHGKDYLVDEFIAAVNMTFIGDHLFDYDTGVAQITCFKSTDPITSSKIRSHVYLVDSPDCFDNFLQLEQNTTCLSPLFISASKVDDPVLQKQISYIVDKIGGIYISNDNLLDAVSTSTNELTSNFHLDQIQRLLREICHTQLTGTYSDLRVQMSFMCGDSFKPDVLLSPLLDQANQTNMNGNSFSLDQHLPNENSNIRVRLDVVPYHSWMLSTNGWPVNSIAGHILVYSPLRVASWRHAELAARMLVASVGSSKEKRKLVGKSILLLAIDDPCNFFNDKNSRLHQEWGSKLAEEIGASFAVLSPRVPSFSLTELFLSFFELIFNNDPLPPTRYFPAMSSGMNKALSSPESTYRDHQAASFSSHRNSISNESHDSGTSVVTNRSNSQQFSTSVYGNEHMSYQDATKRNNAQKSSGGQHQELNGAFADGLYQNMDSLSNGDPCYASTDVIAVMPPRPSLTIPDSSSSSLTTAATESHSKYSADRAPSRSNIENVPVQTIEIETPPPYITGVVQMSSARANGLTESEKNENENDTSNITTINIPTLDKASTSAIKLRVNGTERHFDDQCNGGSMLTDDFVFCDEDSPNVNNHRLSLKIRSHSSESIFFETGYEKAPVASPSTPSTSTTKTGGSSYSRFKRQGSLKDCQKRKSSLSAKRSIFSTDGSSNLAKFVASFRSKQKSVQNDNTVEVVNISRLDSLSSGSRQAGTSISVPPSPNMQKKSVSKMSSAFSWLPNRSQKRSQRAKSEGGDRNSASPTPGESLQIMCESTDNAVNGMPLFITKCIEYIEENGGLEVEGIYRLSGNLSQVNDLERSFRANPNIDLKSLKLPIHVFATGIKKFFDNLPDPIIPLEIQPDILDCVELELASLAQPLVSNGGASSSSFYNSAARQRQLDCLAKIMQNQLPLANKRVLAYLFAHLKRVERNYQKTSMNIRNLSKIFVPTLFRPLFESFEIMQFYMNKYELALFLILDNYETISDICI